MKLLLRAEMSPALRLLRDTVSLQGDQVAVGIGMVVPAWRGVETAVPLGRRLQTCLGLRRTYPPKSYLESPCAEGSWQGAAGDQQAPPGWARSDLSKSRWSAPGLPPPCRQEEGKVAWQRGGRAEP